MAEIINLNQFRKDQRRQERQKTADDNRVKFGRRKAERQRDDAEQEKRRRNLEQLQLTSTADNEDSRDET